MGRRNFSRYYAAYLFTLIAYIAAFISASFYAKVAISRWTLLVAFLSYNLIAVIGLYLSRRRAYARQLLVATLLTLSGFLVLAGLFARTYDTSYDGMFYHQPAIIALARGWNPLYQASPAAYVHIPQTFAAQLMEGDPKLVWEIEAAVYQATGSISAAMCLNLILALVACVFAYTALRELGLSNRAALTLALLAVTVEATADQLFSFREDGISYDLFLIAASSVAMLAKGSKDRVLYYGCLTMALILMAGAKLSNVFVLGPFIVLVMHLSIRQKWYKQTAFRLTAGAGFLLAAVALLNPYATNWYRYGAVDYPYNLTSVAQFARDTAVPLNLRSDNRLQLLFYGVFSHVNSANSTTQSGNARLKIPFSSNEAEMIAESKAVAKAAGGYGLLFSGLAVVSGALYAYFLAQYGKGRVIIQWLSASLLLVVATGLLNPFPNYGRYTPELELIPVAVVVAWLLLRRRAVNFPGAGLLLKTFVALIACNAIFGLLLVLSLDGVEFHRLNRQLAGLRSSDATYSVHAGVFYANYNLLEEHDVPVQTSPNGLHCANMQILEYSRGTTQLCKI